MEEILGTKSDLPVELTHSPQIPQGAPPSPPLIPIRDRPKAVDLT